MAKIVFNEQKKIYERAIIEEDVVKEIITRLTFAKIRVYRERENLPTGYRMSDPGHPDLYGRIPAKYFGNMVTTEDNIQRFAWALPFHIEVKRPGEMAKYRSGKLPQKRILAIDRQKDFINDAVADGCIAFFAESWEDVVAEFKKYGILLPN